MRLINGRRLAVVCTCLASCASGAIALSFTASASAAICREPHCYAIAYQYTGGVIGDKTTMVTQGSDVYGWANGFDRYNNEIWGIFPNSRGGWVEIGQYAGASYGGQQTSSCCSLHYFFAHSYSSGGEGYTETDAPNGPAVDQSQEYSVQYSGQGTIWCVLLNGYTIACYSGYPSESTLAELGLEAHIDPGETLYNYGVAINNQYQATNGAWYGWGSASYLATSGSHFCAYQPAGYSGGSLAFGSGGCESEDIALNSTVSAISPIASPASGTDPFAEYEPPTGAAISLAKQQAISSAVASEAGDSSPTSDVSTASTLSNAAEAIDPDFVAGVTQSPGLIRWLHSNVYVLNMRGHFTLENAQVPNGDSAPTGSVLSVVVDATTGAVDMIHVGDSVSTASANLAASGTSLG